MSNQKVDSRRPIRVYVEGLGETNAWTRMTKGEILAWVLAPFFDNNERVLWCRDRVLFDKATHPDEIIELSQSDRLVFAPEGRYFVRTAVNAALLPVAVAADAVTMGGIYSGQNDGYDGPFEIGKTYTGHRLQKLKDEAREDDDAR